MRAIFDSGRRYARVKRDSIVPRGLVGFEGLFIEVLWEMWLEYGF